MDDLIIVDCQYDFIDGTLACAHSHEAVAWLVDFINTHEVRALYTSDWHSETNGSFKKNGGIWPVHCVAGSEGRRWIPLLHGISSGRPIVHRRKISSSKVCGMMSKNTLLSMG